MYIVFPEEEETFQVRIASLEERIRQLNIQLENLTTTTTTTDPTRKKFMKHDTCCICFEKPPNLLYPNCGHVCTCETCEEQEDLRACPICRTELTVNKIVI